MEGNQLITEALVLLNSERSKDRYEGLTELKKILVQHRRSPRLDALKDRGYHKIFEALFHASNSEKSTYVRANKQIGKSASATKLELCASTLRLVAEVGVSKLKAKTVKALIDHFIGSIFLSDGSYCEPLRLDYCKALLAILSYPAHVEHLSKTDWAALCSFCIDSIEYHQDRTSPESSTTPNGQAIVISHQNPAQNGASSRPNESSFNGPGKIGGSSKPALEQIIRLLANIVSASNAPLVENAQPILIALTRFLPKASVSDEARLAIVSTINQILSCAAVSCISGSKAIVLDLVSILHSLWPTKLPSLRDELVVLWINCSAFVESILKENSKLRCTEALENLLETLKRDYGNRGEKDQLNLENVQFRNANAKDHSNSPLQIRNVVLRRGNKRNEERWMVPSIISHITSLLGTTKSRNSSVDDHDDDGEQPKRRKLDNHFQALLRDLRLASRSSRISTLQVLTFLLSRNSLELFEIQLVIESLIPSISDNDHAISSWAMIALSSCAFQNLAKDESLNSWWAQIWPLGMRGAGVLSTCRSACHLLDILILNRLVAQSLLAEGVEVMFSSPDLYGPASLCDSSASLWVSIGNLRALEAPSDMVRSFERLLRWLFSRWTPSLIAKRHKASGLFQNASSTDIANILLLCIGQTEYRTRTNLKIGVYGRICQAAFQHEKDQDLQSYLLLLDNDSRRLVAQSEETTKEEIQGMPEPMTIFDTNRRIISKFILTEFSKASDSLAFQIENYFQQITIDLVRSATSICLVGTLLLPKLQSLDSTDFGQVSSSTQMIASQLESIISRRDSDATFVQTAVDVVSQHLPDISSDTPWTIHSSENVYFNQFAKLLYSAIRSRGSGATDLSSIMESESMEIDEDFDSQPSRHGGNGLDRTSREHSFAETSPTAFTQAVIAQLCLVTAMIEEDSETPPSYRIPSTFVDYITSLNPNDVVSCRPLLRLVVSPESNIDRADAAKLLIHISETTLQSYEFERCETSLLLCLDLMIGTLDMWTSLNVIDDLSEIGFALHEWFLNIALGKGIASSDVLIRIADYLQRLLEVSPNLGKNTSTPSVRSSFFLVLKEGDVRVKFYVADQISDIFKLFVLSKHDAVFDDILKNLPTEEDWIEGLALRLWVLARLAASWTTLLRKSVYHIFETPGLIPTSALYAKRCFLEVSSALEFSDPREIFRTFAPQLLFTWTALQSFLSIPFSIFGYETFPDLLVDVQEELTAQLLMRGNDSAINDLENHLGHSASDLLTKAFPKTFAYSIARDISVPPTANDGVSAGSELRLRKHLGKDQFLSLIIENMPSILSILVNTLEQEEQIERAFSENPEFKPALVAWREMRVNASQEVLPPNQQPSFRARYLADELEHLCRRSPKSIDQLWDSSTVVFVLRNLLDSIHPALGALHACSVIRRIRVVIAMAGQTALQDYPIQMLLHAFRPFLTEHHCADDAFGIVQYLFSHGRPYLIKKPSFVAGIAMSILISLKSFISSSQASTTQEVHHQTTMSRAQNFHAWFASYLVSYDLPHLSGMVEASFRAMIKNALDVRERGNASIGSSESSLLLELFDDQASGRKFLTAPAQQQVISLLCKDFEGPLSHREDFLGSDELSSKHVKTIWDSSQKQTVAPQYMQWAARVLGRTYASTGDVPKELVEESSFKELKSICKTKISTQLQSHVGIFKLVQDLLMSDQPFEARVAERTLQLIVSRLSEIGQVSEVEQILPVEILSSMNCTPTVEPSRKRRDPNINLSSCFQLKTGMHLAQWTQEMCLALIVSVPDDLIIDSLWFIVAEVPGFAMSVFPLLLHTVLQQQVDGKQTVREILSGKLTGLLEADSASSLGHVKTLLTALLYLRSQPLPREMNSADRDKWLEVDYEKAAKAAVRCKMYKTALLFYEIRVSQPDRDSRRMSTTHSNLSSDFFRSVFDKIDEPDSFYGIQGDSGLVSVLSRAEHEQDGFKSLSIQGALLDCQMRSTTEAISRDFRGVVKALSSLNMNTISMSLLQNSQIHTAQSNLKDSMLSTARKLEQWDIPIPPSQTSEAKTVFKAYQVINSTNNMATILATINTLFLDTIKHMRSEISDGASLHPSLRALAVLTEIDEVLTCGSSEDLTAAWQRLVQRQGWMAAGRFESVDQLLSARETLFSSLARRDFLRDVIRCSPHQARKIEALNLLESSSMSRRHGSLQHSLSTSAYLSSIVKPCADIGFDIEAVAHDEVTNVLWEQGETRASIEMLDELTRLQNHSKFTINVNRPELLAKLGYRISEARLKNPDEIINQYLLPAINELQGQSEGLAAGKVFHTFAEFCDHQFQHPDSTEDLQRLRKLRQQKQDEIEGLDRLIKSPGASNKAHLQSLRSKARQWFSIDDREYQRLVRNRQTFLTRSLENYLRCLKACDTFNKDALRFCALWLENSDNSIANEAVMTYLSIVPSRKFAPLMNQLSSRLLDTGDDLSELLYPLILRICKEHPYHGMYQVFSSSRAKSGSQKDSTAVARQAAALRIASQLKDGSESGRIWTSVDAVASQYVKIAGETLDDRVKPGSRVPLRKLHTGPKFEKEICGSKISPPTMQIDIRADCNYRGVPIISKVSQELSVASGVSAPKIITLLASNGQKFKQLIKGGNDDLRQDAIMEQVFEQVSELLQADRATRQRNLRIRTYKVVPLTARAGIIEFVPNTIPLHDYLLPAHEKYYPKDWKPPQCRKAIADAQTKSVDQRVKTFRQVADHFHPVLRYFFSARFENPDDWFERKIAYSRSTAAISILGYVLGLGDRHGHNILLDDKTGEVVHIDLGVAFEQGRILPVPEVVPFRLTRDIIDGMGVTKTEGVFRRCCEFILQALRNEAYSIMTVLDVLRYDPLYQWTVSPVRAKRMQQAQSEQQQSEDGNEILNGAKKKETNEPNEADRALTVVTKKLSKALSVTATVNELIQQASDDRNLAVLYAGWAAYA